MATGRRIAGTPGTGFIGLDEWQSANRGAAKSIVDRLAGGAESSAIRAEHGLDTLRDDYWTRLQNSAMPYDEAGLTPEEAQRRATQEYAGPNTLADMPNYNAAMGAADKAGQDASRLGSLYGRGNALQDTFGKGRQYTTGQRLLDSALAGGAGGSRFAQLGQQWGGLFDRAQEMERSSSDTAKEARNSFNDARQRYAEAVPRLRTERENRNISLNDAYVDRMERQQDENERRGGVAGSEGGGKRRNRSYNSLDDWTTKGGWA